MSGSNASTPGSDRSTRRVVLARRPVGMPGPQDFRLERGAVPPLAPGEALITNRLLSMDPAIRGFLDDRPSYLPPVAIGEAIRGMSLGEVIESRNPALAEGALVRALTAWEESSVISPDAIGLEVVDADPATPLEHYLGVLGPSGLTAWIGLNAIGNISAGQTVLISAAAGAVGSVAGQIARLQGCRVVGLAGSTAKVRELRTLGFHAAIDYRTTADLGSAIRAACPDGVDVYFDNVGGAILELTLPLMRIHGVVVVCGMVSDYNHQDEPYPVRTLWQIVVKRLTLRGFLTYEHAARIPEAQARLIEWVRAGALRGIDTVHRGLDAAPAALIAMLAGDTVGKTIVRL